MSVLKRGHDGQVILKSGSFDLARGREEALRRNISHLKLFFGESKYEPTKGVPYFESIFHKQASQGDIEAILKSEIMSIKGNLSLISFGTSITDRKLHVSYEVLTSFAEDSVKIEHEEVI